MNRDELHRLARLWRRHHAVRRLGWSAAAALGTAALALLVRLQTLPVGLLCIGAFVVVWHCLQRRTPVVTVEDVAEHINRTCPSVEESANLWLRDVATLSLVELLQLRRLNAAWAPHRGTNLGGPNPNALRQAQAVCSLAALLFVVVILLPQSPRPISTALEPIPTLPGRERSPEPFLISAALEIQPPSYLSRASRRIPGLDAEVEAGSEVTWTLELSPDIAGVELPGAGTNGPLSAEHFEKGRFTARALVFDTRVYQLAFRHTNGTRLTNRETYLLKAIPDAPPQLTWQSPIAVHIWIDPSNSLPSLPLKLEARDDHQVTRVDVVLTLTQGSGEGVRFREQILPLARAADPESTGQFYSQSLDLNALGLKPGDELYFHAVAFDNRSPTPNPTRSDTRFITVRSPETTRGDPAVVLSGVQRMPQYFRSQRQLIIDTEQLLADRSSLSEDQFRIRSENLGIDQKLLRLRYGQFLGESFESSAEYAPREAQAMEWAATLRGPDRDEVRREAAIRRAAEEAHDHESSTPFRRQGHVPPPAEMLAPLTHVHDNPEAATLFNEQVKSSLRAVLAAMWEAEGHLRVARPDAALPSENRALEILKALQQADRISVRRVGFDPPPIKIDERRLKGDLEKIPESAVGTITVPGRDENTLALRQAIASLSDPRAEPPASESVARVDAVLVNAVQTQPDRYRHALEYWRSRDFATAIAEPTSASDSLRHALWSLVPPLDEPPQRRPEPDPALESRYLGALNESPISAR